MSAEANIEFVKRAYADFGRGDVAAILAGLADNIEWITPGEGLPTAGTRHGKAEVAEFFRLVAETWNFTALEPREFVASGDDVAAIGSYTAIAIATGRSVSSDWVMTWKIRDGKLLRFQEYSDTLAAKNAVTARAAA